MPTTLARLCPTVESGGRTKPVCEKDDDMTQRETVFAWLIRMPESGPNESQSWVEFSP